MKQRLLHTPEGVRDVYKDECTKKLALESRLHQVCRRYGYHDIKTPSYEFFEVFSREIGSISSRELFKFFDRDGETLVLRPDITPSIARASAKLFEEGDMPVRLCYQGQTFINHTSYQGRLKETTQLGVELLGDDSVMADAEMIVLIIDALKTAGLKEFQVSVGQVNFLKSLVQEAGMEEEAEELLKKLIVNKNHFGVEELLAKQDITDIHREVFLKLPELFGSLEILDEAKKLTGNQAARKAIERLEQIYRILKLYGVESYVTFDLGMTGNYMYYSGAIFRAYTFGTGDAIVKGGRYDRLLRAFGTDKPAVGFAIVVDELMSALSRQKIPIPIENDSTLILYEASEQDTAIALATSFRRQGMNIELTERLLEKPVEEYKEQGKRNHLGGIIHLMDQEHIKVINLIKGTEQMVDTAALLKSNEGTV